jgi:hypothetical protein
MHTKAMISCTSDVVICTAHPPSPQQLAQAPICHHWRVISPYCTAAPLLSRWRIQRSGLGLVSNYPTLLKEAKHTFNNCIDRTAFLAEATIDALCHVNIISCCPSATIFSLFRFDCDCRRRTYRFAQLARDASLLAGGVSSQGMLAAEPRGDGTLFEGVVDCITSFADRQSFALGSEV